MQETEAEMHEGEVDKGGGDASSATIDWEREKAGLRFLLLPPVPSVLVGI